MVNGFKQLGMDLLAGRGGEGAGSQVAPWTQVNGKPVLSSKDGKPLEFSSLAKSLMTLKWMASSSSVRSERQADD